MTFMTKKFTYTINGIIMKIKIFLFFFISILLFSNSCKENNVDKAGDLLIGWASVDITPGEQPVLLRRSLARVSEGIHDPVTATALAIESGAGASSEKTIMISTDLVVISDGNLTGTGDITRDEVAYINSDGTLSGTKDNLLDNVRNLLKESIPEVNPGQIFINATHSHNSPCCSSAGRSMEEFRDIYGVELDLAMTPFEYQEYASGLIAKAAERAWKDRKTGGISYGLGHAVVGRNRLQVDFSGKSGMYGSTNRPEFSHVEGYEDHSVNLLYTWDKQYNLTGVVINLACPSQVSEPKYYISADFWHDTRMELRKRLGKNIFILPQASPSGDQSPHIMVGEEAEARMQKIMYTKI